MLLIEYFTVSYVSSVRDLEARQQIPALFKAEFDLCPFSVTFFLRPFSHSSLSPGSTVCKFKARDSKELLNYIGAMGSGGPQIARIPKCWRSKKDELLQCVPVATQWSAGQKEQGWCRKERDSSSREPRGSRGRRRRTRDVLSHNCLTAGIHVAEALITETFEWTVC